MYGEMKLIDLRIIKMKNYDKFIARVMKTYGCTKKTAVEALKQAYMHFLSVADLEEFILKELKGGGKTR